MENSKDNLHSSGISAMALIGSVSYFGGAGFPVADKDFVSALEEEDFPCRAARVTELIIPEFAGKLSGITQKAYGGGDEYASLAKADDGLFFLDLYDENRLTYRDMALSVAADYISLADRITGDERNTVIIITGDARMLATARFCEKQGQTAAAFYTSDASALAASLLTCPAEGELTAICVADCPRALKEAVSNFLNDANTKTLLKENNVKAVVADGNSPLAVIPQVSTYFSAYADLTGAGELQNGQTAIFAVPEDCEDLLYAGLIAAAAGLPLKLVCALPDGKKPLDGIIYEPITRAEAEEAAQNLMDEYGAAVSESTARAYAACEKYSSETGVCARVIISAVSPYADAAKTLSLLGEKPCKDETSAVRKLESLTALPLSEKILGARIVDYLSVFDVKTVLTAAITGFAGIRRQ